MEAVGLGVGIAGLAGLFKVVLEAADQIQSYRSYDQDLLIIQARFTSERIRLRAWGRFVGVAEGKDELPTEIRARIDAETVDAIQSLLRGALTCLQAKLKALTESKPPSTISKTKWALSRKRTLEGELGNFSDIVRQLHDHIEVPKSLVLRRRSSALDPDEKTRVRRAVQKHISDNKIRQEKTRKDVFSWIGGSSASDEKLSDTLKSRLPDTCDWILGSPHIHRWLKMSHGDPNILWLNGHAGFGKTVICAHLAQYLKRELGTPVATFFSTGFRGGEDAYVVLRSWITQLATDDAEVFCLVYDECLPSPHATAPPSSLCSLLERILHLKTACTLIVDGLDECIGSEQARATLHKMISRLRDCLAEDTRVLIVSRHDNEIQQALVESHSDNVAEMTITTEDVHHDLRILSEDIFRRKVTKEANDPRHAITKLMVQGCDGQFQWLRMQEDEGALNSWMNLEQLEKRIKDTPKKLDEIYDRNWTRIQSHERCKRAFSILRWATCSVRPLTIAEIAAAALIDEQDGDFAMDYFPVDITKEYIEKEILKLCSPLLKIRLPDQSDPARYNPCQWTLHVIHFTVREYVVRHLPTTELCSNIKLQKDHERMQHEILARFCLNYVGSEGVWRAPTDQVPSLLRNYAATSWHVHLNKCRLEDPSAPTLKLALAFVSESHPCWLYWRRWYDQCVEDMPEIRGEQYNMAPDSTYYAIKLQITPVVTEKAKEKKDKPQLNARGRSAFQIACSLGYTSTVRTFLDAGTDVNVRGWRGRSPIFTAAITGQTELIRFLIGRGGNVNLVKDDGIAPLHTAIENDHLETTKLLLSNGARMDPRNPRGWTPLHMAASRGRLRIMELMLDAGGVRYINSETYRGLTPVHFSVVEEHSQVSKLLIDRGADVHIGDKAGWLPIHAAAGRGHVAIVQTLLDKGASMNTPVKSVAGFREGFDGWTGMHLAAYYHRRHILEQLQTTTAFDNADLTVVTEARRETPLHMAAISGDVFAMMLYMSRSDVNAKDTSGHTPLFLATQQGQDAVVEILLEDRRIKVSEASDFGLTPLDVAVRNGHSTIVKLILEAADSLEDQDTKLKGRHLMEWARRSHNPRTLHLLNKHAHKLSAEAIQNDPQSGLDDVFPASWTRERAWCYSCSFCLPKDAMGLGYRCVKCDGGYRYFCFDCVRTGAQCGVESHKLVDLREEDVKNRYEYVN